MCSVLFEGYGCPRDRHVLTHSGPSLRSADLLLRRRSWPVAWILRQHPAAIAGGDHAMAHAAGAGDDVVILPGIGGIAEHQQVGRAHVCTPVTNAHSL